MKKIFITLFICSSLQLANSQSGWVHINPGFGQSYNSVHFIDANTGMACGDNGAMIKTTDGGLSWFNINSGTSIKLNDIKMFDSNIAVAVGGYQSILRTTNGGQNWTVVNQSGQNYLINNLRIYNNSSATAFFKAPSIPFICKTSDMGATWVFQQMTLPNSTSWIDFIDFNTGWSCNVSENGQSLLTVNKSVNGGSNWNLVSQGSQANPEIIYFFNSSFGQIVDQNSGGTSIFGSINGGFSWDYEFSNNNYNSIRCFYFPSSTKGWFVGDGSTIYVTTNTGANWIQQISPVANINLNKVYFVNENIGWIAASAAGILKTTDGGGNPTTGINMETNFIPGEFSLSQNYPNPFNPVTKIKFDIPVGNGRDRSVKLIIYDILGREVATLVNEALKPGSYEIEWDGSNFASGIYFYSLQTEEFTQTKKMVLMK